MNPHAVLEEYFSLKTMTHAECVDAAARWARSKHGVVLAEFVCMNSEICDVIAFQSGFSTMIECKVSRADFLRDKRKRFRRMPEYGMGNYRMYCAPKGLIRPDELPEKWGLLEVNEQGKVRATVSVHAYNRNRDSYFPSSDYSAKAEMRVLYSVARRATIKGCMPKILEVLPQL